MKVLKKSLTTIMCVAIILTAAAFSGLMGFNIPDWLDFSVDANAIAIASRCLA